MESDVITLQDIFIAKAPTEDTATGIRSANRLLNPLACTGLKPHFLEKLAASGVVLPPTFFQEDGTDGYRPSFAASQFGSFQ
jgi:pilus assembly protein CpaF